MKETRGNPGDLLQGTLDLLILKALVRGAMHGHAVAEWIHQTSEDILKVEEGALYPALHRLELRGLLSSEWGTSDNNRRAKFYSLTSFGKKQLAQETEFWRRMMTLLASHLSTQHDPPSDWGKPATALLWSGSPFPLPFTGALRPVISSIDPDLGAESHTLEELLRMTAIFFLPSFAAAIATPVGVIGLLLALMGIYGTVSYIVVLRTREVGIRLALGAQKCDILGLLLREITQPVLAGLFVGMFLAAGASYLLRGALHGLNTVDGISFAGVSLSFLAIALFAAWFPSRQVIRVDPMVVLRHE
jgi:PadR family transcriptional regulator PadR